MGTLMEPRIKDQDSSVIEHENVQTLLRDLNSANEQLKQANAFNEVLKSSYKSELESLVEERTQELERPIQTYAYK